MNRNYNIEFYRCLCMLGIVCTHAFSWDGKISYPLMSLSSPALIGFVMISGWFGIHYRPMKIVRLMGVVITCSIVWAFLSGNGLSATSWYGKGYWYVWAYIFVMMLSPIVDDFVENCEDRQRLLAVFASVGFLLWVWSFFAQTVPRYIPMVIGFTDCSGIILFLVYILTRLIRKLGWEIAMLRHRAVLLVVFVVSAFVVSFGFRHNNSVFAFVYAFSGLLLCNALTLPRALDAFIAFVSPSMFSVYLFHMPLFKFFPEWVELIDSTTQFPHPLSQFILAVCVFIGCILVDMPRRFFLFLCRKMYGICRNKWIIVN